MNSEYQTPSPIQTLMHERGFDEIPPLVEPDLQIRARNWKLVFLFRNQNICCLISKQPSQWDGSFEHQNMFDQI